MTHAPIRVLLVDDQDLIRTGFALILSSASGSSAAQERPFEVVGEAADGATALDLMTQLHAAGRAPEVVLMDVRMPGIDGIETTGRIVEAFADTRVIVLTTFDLDEYALAAIQAGASGFLLKDSRAAELVSAVRAVAGGDSVMAPSVTRRLIERLRGSESDAARHSGRDRATDMSDGANERLASLTDREVEVFEAIADGLSNAEIGERLFLSESTVKTHVGRVLAKLQLRDRVHAVILAYEIGLR